MIKLVKCPECGKYPVLQTLAPNYPSYKYFCCTSVACGNWQKTDRLAKHDWNKRIKEYKELMVNIGTPGTKEWIYSQGVTIFTLTCKECGYELKDKNMKDIVFEISMGGGCFSHIGSGKFKISCPICKSGNLKL